MRISYRWRPVALATALLSATVVAPVAAHEGNPHYRSEVRSISPAAPGLTARVLDHDDALEVTNRSGRAVLVAGYQGEPYLRILADRTVQVNDNSVTAKAVAAQEAQEHHETSGHTDASAGYTLVSFDYAHAGEEDVDTNGSGSSGEDDSHASDHAAAHWVTLDKTGRYAWHDDRIKWRKTPVAPQVTDQSKETKIFDWHVPIRVGAQAGTIEGTLFWVGDGGASSGFPVAAVVSLVILALLAAGAVVLVRRRRQDAGGPPSAPGA